VLSNERFDNIYVTHRQEESSRRRCTREGRVAPSLDLFFDNLSSPIFAEPPGWAPGGSRKTGSRSASSDRPVRGLFMERVSIHFNGMSFRNVAYNKAFLRSADRGAGIRYGTV